MDRLREHDRYIMTNKQDLLYASTPIKTFASYTHFSGIPLLSYYLILFITRPCNRCHCILISFRYHHISPFCWQRVHFLSTLIQIPLLYLGLNSSAQPFLEKSYQMQLLVIKGLSEEF